MVSAILTLMMDSLMLAFYNRQKKGGAAVVVDHESPMNAAVPVAHVHGHCGPPQLGKDEKEGEETALRRNRVIVQVRLASNKSLKSFFFLRK